MKKVQDSLGRTLRTVRNRAEGRIVPLPREIDWFEFIARNGGELPTDHIHQYTAHQWVDRNHSLECLKLLFWGGWFDRDDHQFMEVDYSLNEPKLGAFINRTVHRISKKAKDLLKSEGRWSEWYPDRAKNRRHWKHQIFCNSIQASVEIEAAQLGIDYWSEYHLLEEANHPLRFKSPKFEKHLIPDVLFSVRIDDVRFLCFVECDRAFEQQSKPKTSRPSWSTRRDYYLDLFSSGYLEKVFPYKFVPLLLHITTAHGHMATMVNTSNNSGNILHICLPEFGVHFKPTLPTKLLTLPWTRGNGKQFIFARS